MPKPPGPAYVLCDSWGTSNKLIDDLAQKGYDTIGALCINRIIYPNQAWQQFESGLCKNDSNVVIVTFGKRSYYVYWYLYIYLNSNSAFSTGDSRHLCEPMVFKMQAETYL